jgi:hypothetical protein
MLPLQPQLKHRRRRMVVLALVASNLFFIFALFICIFRISYYSTSSAASSSLSTKIEATADDDVNENDREKEKLEATIVSLEKKIHEFEQQQSVTTTKNVKYLPPDLENVHYVMTTDCGRYSDWQSVIAYNSLRKTGFKGNFTRLIACEKVPERVMSYATFFSDFYVTPFYGNNPGPDFFPPLAKPNSIMGWIEDGPGRFIHDDQQIVLIDQDFISLDYLRPQASCGSPMAQKYGMGDGFLRDGTADKYCRGKCKDFKGKIDDYLVGPPYMLCMGDLRKIGVLWRDITREITKNSKYGQHNKEWLADMYGYIMGSIIHGLPHQTRVDWMISVADSASEWIDFYQASVYAPSLGRVPHKFPPTLHVCQQYEVPFSQDASTSSKKKALMFNKHEFHERDLAALLSCDEKISQRRLLNTISGKKKNMESLEIGKIPFDVPTFEEALKATLDARKFSTGKSEAKLLRNKWALGTFVIQAEGAFKEFRRRMCKEPMDAF